MANATTSASAVALTPAMTLFSSRPDMARVTSTLKYGANVGCCGISVGTAAKSSALVFSEVTTR